MKQFAAVDVALRERHDRVAIRPDGDAAGF